MDRSYRETKKRIQLEINIETWPNHFENILGQEGEADLYQAYVRIQSGDTERLIPELDIPSLNRHFVRQSET